MIQIYIYIFFFRFFSLIGYYKILSIVPCAIQWVLAGYLLHIFISPVPRLCPCPGDGSWLHPVSVLQLVGEQRGEINGSKPLW